MSIGQVWSVVDVESVTKWPNYTEDDAARFAHIPWANVCELAFSMVTIGEPSTAVELPGGLADDIRNGLELVLVGMPIQVTKGHLIDGGHRLLAMRRQGVRFTIGVADDTSHSE